VLGDTHTFFARAEPVQNSALFGEGHPLHDQESRIRKLSLGYSRDVLRTGAVKWGVGGVLGAIDAPASLEPVYGSRPRSAMVFVQGRL